MTYNVSADGKITGIAPITGDVPIGPAGGASLIKLLGTARSSFMNAVKNPKLLNIVKDLYRNNAKIGNGSSMDAFRFEQMTGQAVGGRTHGQKLLDYRNALQKLWNNRSNLNSGDKQTVKQLLKDIQDALSGN